MMRVHIAAVIPAYNVATAIDSVLQEIPPQIGTIIVVDDGSTDDTAAVVERRARQERRIQLIRHEQNGGVGAAMVTGFRKALGLRCDIVVKIDGDGQMPLAVLPKLVAPLIDGEADYVKGNRFRDFNAIRAMPPLRRFGNVGLSFLAKAATGYWQCFDPTNGFIAIRTEVLAEMPLQKIDRGYFFEISMLSHLYLLGGVVKEVPMPARYNGEPSSLSIPRVLAGFPGRLAYSLFRRLFLKNYVYDFSLESIHLATGTILLLVGLIWGGYKWFWYASHRIAAPTGTVALVAVMILLGSQSLWSALALDLQAVPKEPLNNGPLARERPVAVEEHLEARGRVP